MRKLWSSFLIALMILGLMTMVVSADPSPSDEEDSLPKPVVTMTSISDISNS